MKKDICIGIYLQVNVLIKAYDDVLVIKISDFGLAKDPNNELNNSEY